MGKVDYEWAVEANTLCSILISEIIRAETWERMILCGDAIRHVRREQRDREAETTQNVGLNQCEGFSKSSITFSGFTGE